MSHNFLADIGRRDQDLYKCTKYSIIGPLRENCMGLQQLPLVKYVTKYTQVRERLKYFNSSSRHSVKIALISY